MKLFAAMKAFVVFDGKVLILRESSSYTDGSQAGKYDVVGGRVQPGENFKESLLREIKEETGLSVTIGKPFHVGEWRPVVNGEEWQIIGTFFECIADSNEVKLSEEHDDFLWIDLQDYSHYNLIENLKEAFESFLKK